MASTVVRWRWGCVHARVFLSVCECQACPKPSVRQAEGIGQHPQRSAGSRQAGSMSPIAMRQRVQGSHATQHPPRKIPQTRTHKACSMPLLHSHYLSPNSSQLPSPLPPGLPSKPTFTIQVAVHPHKESILNPFGLILLIDRLISYLFFCALHFYIHGSLNQSQIGQRW